MDALAVSPDGRFAYAATSFGAEGIQAFSLAADGSLVAPGSSYGTGTDLDLAITPDGRYLFAADYSTGKLARFAIAADGSLTSLGATAVPQRPEYLTVSPDGRFLFVVFYDGGSETGFTSYAIGADGGLAEVGEPVQPAGVSLYYLTVSPDGAHLYVADANHGVITAAIGADGSLSVLGTTPVEEVKSVAVSPDGRFLYYQYHDETAGEEGIGVAGLAADGTPTPLPGAFEPWPTGEGERIVFAPEPAPTFTASPAASGAATSFDASASVGVVRYDWDFGDGTTLEDGGPTPSHVYASPGTYTATLKVTDANGCSSERIYTGQSTVCPGGAGVEASAAVVVPAPPTEGGGTTTTTPRILSLRVLPKRFHAGRHAGRITFRYRLDEAARVRFKIERKRAGHRARFVKVGTLAAKAAAGLDTTAFSGRLHGRKLSPGSYRVTAVATAGGLRSRPRRASFRIVSR